MTETHSNKYIFRQITKHNVLPFIPYKIICELTSLVHLPCYAADMQAKRFRPCVKYQYNRLGEYPIDRLIVNAYLNANRVLDSSY